MNAMWTKQTTPKLVSSVGQSVSQSAGQLVGWLVGWLVSWLVGGSVFDWDLIGMQRGENGYEATLDTGRG